MAQNKITLSRILSYSSATTSQALPAWSIVYGGDLYSFITNRKRTTRAFWEQVAQSLGLSDTYWQAMKLWSRPGQVILQNNGLAVVYGTEFWGGAAGWMDEDARSATKRVLGPVTERKAYVYTETTKGHQVPIA